ncbi:MAG: YicC/YloC family endoribonuclease [Janthinobacterium lividum]
MTLASMTGFARTEGAATGLAWAWAWELRSVNGRGLDLKMRLPPGFDALEQGLRDQAGKALRRGNVGASLVVKREERARMAADPALLDELLALAGSVASRIPGAPPPRVELLLALPGVMRPVTASEEGVSDAALAAIRDGFTAALAGLVAARQEEGARLAALLSAQLAGIAALRLQAEQQAADQPRLQRDRMMESLAGLLRDQPGLPADRIAQEVALLATRADVREELDRLSAHIDAAAALLAEGAGVGRRFDFLVQEFVRETNTLCSKSASVPLTATGLQMKALIEQMREQVQNVE